MTNDQQNRYFKNNLYNYFFFEGPSPAKKEAGVVMFQGALFAWSLLAR